MPKTIYKKKNCNAPPHRTHDIATRAKYYIPTADQFPIASKKSRPNDRFFKRRRTSWPSATGRFSFPRKPRERKNRSCGAIPLKQAVTIFIKFHPFVQLQLSGLPEHDYDLSWNSVRFLSLSIGHRGPVVTG